MITEPQQQMAVIRPNRMFELLLSLSVFLWGGSRKRILKKSKIDPRESHFGQVMEQADHKRRRRRRRRQIRHMFNPTFHLCLNFPCSEANFLKSMSPLGQIRISDAFTQMKTKFPLPLEGAITPSFLLLSAAVIEKRNCRLHKNRLEKMKSIQKLIFCQHH